MAVYSCESEGSCELKSRYVLSYDERGYYNKGEYTGGMQSSVTQNQTLNITYNDDQHISGFELILSSEPDSGAATTNADGNVNESGTTQNIVFDYQYDDSGTFTQAQGTYEADGEIEEATISVTYDSEGRLLERKNQSDIRTTTIRWQYNANGLATKLTSTNDQDASISEKVYAYQGDRIVEITYWENDTSVDDDWCKSGRITREYDEDGLLKQAIIYQQNLNDNFEPICDDFKTRYQEEYTYNEENLLELIESYSMDNDAWFKDQEIKFEWTDTGNSWFFEQFGGSDFALPLNGIAPVHSWKVFLYGANPNYYAK